ncbi:hypothetical protein BD408DRAFT_407895 [Parasitella parasitica]|nr:hypothetical protein BD408DRAFT_407895 [Parasitella parasitica]
MFLLLLLCYLFKRITIVSLNCQCMVEVALDFTAENVLSAILPTQIHDQKRMQAWETEPMKLFTPILHSCPPRTKARLLEVSQVNDRVILKQIQDSSSCKKNGSEHLLRLGAFDPTTDTSIELLHTLPLGIAEFLVVFLWKNVLSSTSDKNRLQAALTK